MQWKYIGGSPQEQLDGNLVRHEMFWKQQNFCTYYRSQKYLLFLGTVDCLLYSAFRSTWGFKELFLEMHSEIEELCEFFGNNKYLGTGDRIRQRSLDLFFPCSCLPIFSQHLKELWYFVRLLFFLSFTSFIGSPNSNSYKMVAKIPKYMCPFLLEAGFFLKED